LTVVGERPTISAVSSIVSPAEAQLDQLHGRGIEGVQTRERPVSAMASMGSSACSAGTKSAASDRQSGRAAAALRAPFAPRVVDQDPAHGLGGEAVEMRAALPCHPSLVDELEKRLVHQRSALQEMARPFPGQVPRRQASQFLVHERHEARERFSVAAAPALEELRDVARGRRLVRIHLNGNLDPVGESMTGPHTARRPTVIFHACNTIDAPSSPVPILLGGMTQRRSALSTILTVASPVGLVGDRRSDVGPCGVRAHSNDAGPGSFRTAIAQANSNSSITRILFLGRVGTIALESTVVFTGSQDLTIDGTNAVLDGTEAAGPAFRATGGGDLSVTAVTVRNSPAEGISVDVPTNATGTIRVSLFRVNILDNDGHGVLVDDQDDPATPEVDGDSAASLEVSVLNSRFLRNGFSVSDRDGLRVNEGGAGDLAITLVHSESEDNAADGIEVDERGEGDVRVLMFGSHVTRNGVFDPADLDDGFDIDEADAGSIVGLVFHSSANDNYEEGFDFNENHAGDLRVDMFFVEANGNREEGVDYEEDDDFAGGGDLVTTMFQVTANGNGADGGDAGLKIREKGDGDLEAHIHSAEASNNAIGGISIREDAAGNLVSLVSHASALSNTGHGIDFDENRANATDSGNLTAEVARSTSSNNGGAGVRADQQTPGTGTLLLSNVTLDNNTGGATAGSNVVVTVQ
jgi:hypothetical protein